MSTKWLVAALAFALSLVLLCVLGCGEDRDPIAPTENKTVTVKVVATPPSTEDVDDEIWENAEEAAIRVGEDKAYSNDFGLGLVRTKAISDGEYLYMRFEWRDSTKSIRPGYWTYQMKEVSSCKVWTQNADTNCFEVINELNPRWESEDVLAVLFEYRAGQNGSEGANCATTCHRANPADTTDLGFYHFTTGGGQIDGWVWRAGRTDTLGLAEDLFWGAKEQKSRYDSADAALYVRNVESETNQGDPGWMHLTGHEYNGNFLVAAETTKLVADTIAQWRSRDGIPGYVLNANWNTGYTSRYDVRAISRYDDVLKRWIVVLWRRLAASHPSEDVDFADGRKEFQATLAIMEHAWARHSGSKLFTIKF